MQTKYVGYVEKKVGENFKYYHNWKIIVFLRLVPFLWKGYRTRIID